MRYTTNPLGSIALAAVLAGCVSPLVTPVPTARPSTPPPASTPFRQPSPSPAPPTGQPGLFSLFSDVQVTPADHFLGGAFVRVAHVPGKDRMAVTFVAKLDNGEGDCAQGGYAYAEFNRDMVATGDYGVISCYAATDVGGLFVGDEFYLASMGHDNQTGEDGWHLTKFDAVAWTTLIGPFFFPLEGEEGVGEDPVDPMLAFVNGRIDISAAYLSSADEERGPYVGHATHHQLFTTDLQFVEKRILSDVPHVQLNSMIVAGGVTHFVASTALIGDLVVMRYDAAWNYLGGKTIRKNAAAPEGVAFDGENFYVAYLDTSSCATLPCYFNVHLAAFDPEWNLIEDIAVTSYSPEDRMSPARPSLAYWNGRVYVCYDQAENDMLEPDTDPKTQDIHVHVKVYDLTRS